MSTRSRINRDPIEALQQLRWRGCDPDALALETTHFRVAPSAAGLVAGLARRGRSHARVRTFEASALPGRSGSAAGGAPAAGGLLIRGDDETEELSVDAARTCVQALRDAARLAAEAPVACGAFGLDGTRVHVEISACHDGVRAFVHLVLAPRAGARTAPPVGDAPVDAAEAPSLADPGLDQRDALLLLMADLDVDALHDLHHAVVPPEDLLALRRAARRADVGSLIVRHCDLTLLAVERALPMADRLLVVLHQAVLGCLHSNRWRLAHEPLAECARFCRKAGGAPMADGVRGTFDACWRAATPATRQALAAASQVSGPLLSLATT